MTIRPRPVRIFVIAGTGRNKRKRLMSVLQATSLRKGLEEYARRRSIEEPVFVGNTMSGRIEGEQMIRMYEAQEVG